MPESVYKVIELIGTSKESWEKAASAAVSRAGKSLRDLRVAEVVKLDLQLDAKGGRSRRTAQNQSDPAGTLVPRVGMQGANVVLRMWER